MNYQDLITLLDKASAFDLYRLSLILDDMIDEPKRIIEVKSKLRLGQQVDFLNGKTNEISKVTVGVLTAPMHALIIGHEL